MTKGPTCYRNREEVDDGWALSMAVKKSYVHLDWADRGQGGSCVMAMVGCVCVWFFHSFLFLKFILFYFLEYVIY